MSVHFSSKSDKWATPAWLLQRINDWRPITLDPCPLNWDPSQPSGLELDWNNQEHVYVNPPYGRGIRWWVAKALYCNSRVTMLLPARTDTQWAHELFPCSNILLIRGRLKFGDGKNSAPFPSMLAFIPSQPDLRVFSDIGYLI